MHIEVASCLEGARRAKGLTVIIDVFRAGNTIISCFANGAGHVVPVGNLERAYELKREFPDYFLAGERKSYPPEGFDFGNSPSEADEIDFEGRGVILTTSSGTQGIVNAKNADEILLGTYANASRIIDYIQSSDPEWVTLVPMGFESSVKAEEDEAYALYLKQRLEGKPVDFLKQKQQLLQSEGAERLRRIGKERDLEWCLMLDKYAVLPIYARTEEKLVKI